MKLLRIKIYQPQAHYRLPFTYQRRHTYPIPPYSTVIGFLINVLGISHQDSEDFENLKQIKISIAGKFESKTTEYIWFRNLLKKSHEARFGYVENRFINGHIEHPGGQSPISIDVLNEVKLVIHLAHENEIFLRKIKENLENPSHRLEILHLGRAEDWIVLEEVSEIFDINDESRVKFIRRDADYKHFFWIPESVITANGDSEEYFKGMDGLLYQLPTFCTIDGYDKTYNRHGRRNFDYVKTKLNDGLMVNKEFYFDKEINLPIFLGDKLWKEKQVESLQKV